MQLCLDMRTGAGCGTENPNYAKQCSGCDKPLRFALTLHDPKTQVGRYRVVRVIGYGAYGAVYEAHKRYEPTLLVALKESFDASNISSFEREFRVLSGLQHPNLPRYIDIFSEEGNGYLVMEYVAGQSLQEILDSSNDFSRSGPRTTKVVTTSQVLGYALQLCDVLEYLHSQQPPILHRDIKPANIRLTPEGRIKLVDFGLLKQAGSQTRATIRGLGTPAYAPLEQYGDNQQVTDVRSDIYSLASTLYHLFSGQEPLSAPNRFTGERDPLPPLPPEVSLNVRQAVMKAMSLIARDRFASISHFRQALVGGQSVGADVAEAEQPSLTHSPEEPKKIEIPQVPFYNPFKLDKQKTIIVLRANPQDARAWLILGWIMDKEGKPQRASECYERALKINLRSSRSSVRQHEAGQFTVGTLPTWVELVTSKEEVALISSDLYPSASRSSVRRENDRMTLPNWFYQENNGPFLPSWVEFYLIEAVIYLTIIYFIVRCSILILALVKNFGYIYEFFIFLILCAIFYLLKNIEQIVSSRHWPASEAIVIGSFTKIYKVKSNKYYNFRVVCAYPVDKQIFYSTVPSKNTVAGSVYQSGSHSSDHDLQQKEKEYSFAKPMTIFYNPLQPDMVLHKVGFNIRFYIYLLLTAGLLRILYSIIIYIIETL